ncbi:DUF2892 domain-containing protein [Pelagicoccus sp. NFK12]|uniref:DUF2892 domain-containing protein n=1 Tax=Pelagicoccus enzymogenes TaxID=2773457 RepID=A0A927F7J2_9BACT|nr:DUF2892 domain-containing protein [Pelagicoccus enzymogenes]MBD5779314.1 DUF2892 domain-containing protein [Pelagicoccus enzymogenes]MDQ8198334.1 DUF2892 domain-containing protein [Pelagicoccus enzymogenes]
MNIDRIVFAFAGTMILAGVALGVWVNQFWFILPAFVGLNMFQAAFTRICPLAFMLKKMGMKSGCAFE